MHRQRPRHVVVRLVGRFARELLRLEQVHRVVAIGLVEPDDEAPLLERPLLHGDRGVEPRDLDAVAAQDLDHLRHAPRVALVLRDDERVRVALDALLPRVVALAVEVAQDLLRVLRRPVQDREAPGLHVVRVVAQRPHELLVRRPGAVPLAIRHRPVHVLVRRAQRALDRLGRVVAERLVAAPERVVVGRDRVEVVEAPRLAEAPRPDAGHPERRQGVHLVKRGLQPLVDRDRIEVHVVRPRAVPRVQQRDRLVQIVNGRGVVLVEHGVHGLRELERLLVRVAVVVVEHVVAPVGGRHLGQVLVVRLALQKAVVPVDRLVAAVGLGHGVDEDDHVLADGLDHGLVRHGEPVGQLHDHLGAAGLRRVEARVEVVDRARRGDDLFRLLGRRPARVRQQRGGGLEAVEVGDPVLVGDRDEQDLAPLLRLPDHAHLHARGGLRELPEVAVDLRGPRQLARGPGDVAQVLRRRRHGRRGRNVGDPRISEALLGRELRDRFDRSGLRHVGRVRSVGRGGERGREEECEAHGSGEASGHRVFPPQDGGARRPAAVEARRVI